MPSSRASSPLSSATSSPTTGPAPLPTVEGLHNQMATDADSDRERRSQTSSTAPLSNLSDDESDLTEEDDQELTVVPGQLEQPVNGIKEEGSYVSQEEEEIGDMDEEEEDEEENIIGEGEQDVDMDDSGTVVPMKSEQRSRTDSPSSSLSLTPPPPSVPLRPKGLPAVGANQARSNNHIDDDNSDLGGSEQDIDESEDAEEDDGEDGDSEQEEGEDLENGEAKAIEHGDDGDADDAGAPESPPNGLEHNGLVETGDDPQSPIDVNDEEDQSGEEQGEHPGLTVHVDEPVDEATDEPLDHEVDGEATDMMVPQQSARTHHSSHAPPPTSAHIRELLRLEIKFAALRDQLYVERMEEVAAEEQMILDGTHPALQYLHKTLAERRERLHEVASRRHQETKAELKRARESDKNHTWSWWTEQRDRLHWDEFEATWSKRRRLAREKNEIETPRVVKPIPRAAGAIRTFDWSAGAAPAKMSLDDASSDLAMMENRPLLPSHLTHVSRHASPIVFAPTAAVQQSLLQHSIPAAGPSSTNGMATARQPASVQTQPLSSYSYGGGGHLAYSMPRTTHAVQNVSAPAAANALNRPSAQSRLQGRTVPTTSDFFDSGRKDPTAPSMAWTKPDNARVVNGQGHMTKDALGLTTAAPTSSTPSKAEDRPASRFPGLSEYLNSTNSKSTHAGGTANTGGYASLLNAGSKILSPSNTSTTSILGTFGGRPGGPFTAPQGPSATPAGMSVTRP